MPPSAPGDSTSGADAAVDPDLDDLGYAEAVEELEAILAELDSDNVDVDRLATQVRRAAALIALCRSRLAATRIEVTRIVADLDALAEPTPDRPTDDDTDHNEDDVNDADGGSDEEDR